MPTVDTNQTVFNGVNQNGAVPSPQSSTPAAVDPMLVNGAPPAPVNSPSAAGMLAGVNQSSSQPQAAPSGKQPSFFRRLVMGALQGIAAPAEEAQADIQQRRAQTQAIQQDTAQRQASFPASQEESQLRIQALRNQIAAQPDQQLRDQLENALLQQQIGEAATKISQMNDADAEESLHGLEGFTLKAINGGAQYYPTDPSMGFTGDAIGSYQSALALTQRLQSRDAATNNGKANFNYFPAPLAGPKGRTWGVLEIPSYSDTSAYNMRIKQPQTLTIGGQRITFPVGTPKSLILKAQLQDAINQVHANHEDKTRAIQNQITAIKEKISTLRQNPESKLPGSAVSKQIDMAQAQLDSLTGITPQQRAAQQQSGLPQGNGQFLTDPSIAQQFLKAAGGDKKVARKLAAQNGWKF